MDRFFPPWCFPCPSLLTSPPFLQVVFPSPIFQRALCAELQTYIDLNTEVLVGGGNVTKSWLYIYQYFFKQDFPHPFPLLLLCPPPPPVTVHPVKQVSPFSLTQSVPVMVLFFTLLQVSWLEDTVPREKCSSENVMTSWPQTLPLFIARLNYSCPPWITSLCKGMS